MGCAMQTCSICKRTSIQTLPRTIKCFFSIIVYLEWTGTLSRISTLRQVYSTHKCPWVWTLQILSYQMISISILQNCHPFPWAQGRHLQQVLMIALLSTCDWNTKHNILFKSINKNCIFCCHCVAGFSCIGWKHVMLSHIAMLLCCYDSLFYLF